MRTCHGTVFFSTAIGSGHAIRTRTFHIFTTRFRVTSRVWELLIGRVLISLFIVNKSLQKEFEICIWRHLNTGVVAKDSWSGQTILSVIIFPFKWRWANATLPREICGHDKIITVIKLQSFSIPGPAAFTFAFTHSHSYWYILLMTSYRSPPSP